jgi:Di-haem cytochrome c peroxidase
MKRNGLGVVASIFLIAAAAGKVAAFPVNGDQTVLPEGTELNEDSLNNPREVFHSEALRGRKSYLVNLGDLLFNSPSILGGVARQAGIRCGTCHVNGAGNPKLFVPGMSTRPGNFDTTGPLFNPNADNQVLDPVRVPSLRGARFLAPYGVDGRTASLREFVRNVIVSEFAGPEPSPGSVDAIVAYINDIDFLPNPDLGTGGRLTAVAMASERRGEALFARPFPNNPDISCATCHERSGAFVDHRQHDVGSGGLFKTPTLMNANYNAPYFHDGRYDTYEQVVEHFDRVFALGYSDQDRHDLVDYLNAVGNGMRPFQYEGTPTTLKEINDFASVLGAAIAANDKETVAVAVDTIGGELRELTEFYPDRKDTSVSGGDAERGLVRHALKEQVLTLRRIDLAVASGRLTDAAADFQAYRERMVIAVPTLMNNAEQWSLFTRTVHDAHYDALRQTMLARRGPIASR